VSPVRALAVALLSNLGLACSPKAQDPAANQWGGGPLVPHCEWRALRLHEPGYPGFSAMEAYRSIFAVERKAMVQSEGGVYSLLGIEGPPAPSDFIRIRFIPEGHAETDDCGGHSANVSVKGTMIVELSRGFTIRIPTGMVFYDRRVGLAVAHTALRRNLGLTVDLDANGNQTKVFMQVGRNNYSYWISECPQDEKATFERSAARVLDQVLPLLSERRMVCTGDAPYEVEIKGPKISRRAVHQLHCDAWTNENRGVAVVEIEADWKEPPPNIESKARLRLEEPEPGERILTTFDSVDSSVQKLPAHLAELAPCAQSEVHPWRWNFSVALRSETAVVRSSTVEWAPSCTTPIRCRLRD
jgi:hypothetical protein